MSIPIEIILFALRNKKLSQLKLYIYLKYVSSGTILVSEKTKKITCEALNWKDSRTFNSNIKWLLNQKWASYNSKTQSLRIASYKQVYHKIKGKKLSGVRIGKEDFKTFRPFIYAAAITWSIKMLSEFNLGPERIKGISNMSHKKLELNILPNEYFAQIIHSNKSTASRYKNAARDAKYIVVKHQLIRIKLNKDLILAMKKYLTSDAANTLIIKGNRTYLQQADLIYSNISLICLKRLKHDRNEDKFILNLSPFGNLK